MGRSDADRAGGQNATQQWTRRALAGGAFAHAACMSSLARAAQQTIEPPAIIPLPSQELVVTPGLLGTVGAFQDPGGRIIAPVFINGKGPFKFFVDTGANRSALSARLAAQVGALPEGEGVVHGVGGTRVAPMVRVDSIRSGAFEMRDRVIPILGDDLIVPADGMLGVDGFAGLRLEFDNTFRTMNVRRSSRGWDVGEGVGSPGTELEFAL